ncbi:UDP-2,4-diacetamido-2,4,6-trideoxy-beta-L-altropyranose hydrolase [Aliiglaciecola lipolytica]|uniref:UDP-2,4-diacetamido-2,4, 6-trideoxy-beta-L-altropyranose hydrolase n=1 Tax=Aliiglaciecola lipolytica E3 TaxID=1127673 RepID=K6X3H8_9ALTE|nr:UDP-2,4-diacetamido-2,4,6-trideoxy-beta-L-altropyranose hydrolase [Aliiglaciecola lipolytica]GAC15199.1 hypothetical protein GLIP_2574 [Aliiglaciecola lipolytica E3]
MQHILFRVNASIASGLGHLMRCLALAQAAVRSDLLVAFMLNRDALVISKQRLDWVGEVLEVPDNYTDEQEIAMFSEFCSQHAVVAVVIDGYQFSPQYRQKIANLSRPVVCFDDMNNSGNLFANLIINGSANAHQLGYQLNQPATRLCIGEKFRVLRQEFCDLTPLPISQRSMLTISLGGSDPANLTLPILQALEQQEFTNKVQVITGAAYPYLSELHLFLENTQLDFVHIHDCQNVAQCFLQSRFAISAAGGSQFELQATGTPSYLLVVAENQLNATQVATQQGGSLAESFVKVKNKQEQHALVKTIVTRTLALWKDIDALEKMQWYLILNADTNGAKRIVEQIKELVLHG